LLSHTHHSGRRPLRVSWAEHTSIAHNFGHNLYSEFIVGDHIIAEDSFDFFTIVEVSEHECIKFLESLSFTHVKAMAIAFATVIYYLSDIFRLRRS